MDLQKSLLKTEHIDQGLFSSFFFSLTSHPRVTPQVPTIKVQLQGPTLQGSTLGFHSRVPPQGPTLETYLRVPPLGPALGSHSRVPPECPGSRVSGHFSGMPWLRIFHLKSPYLGSLDTSKNFNVKLKVMVKNWTICLVKRLKRQLI